MKKERERKRAVLHRKQKWENKEKGKKERDDIECLMPLLIAKVRNENQK